MFRQFRKTIFTTVLNIIGLSVAFAAFIIIMIQVNYDLRYNKGFKDSDKIYRVEGAFNLADMNVYSPFVSRPLALKFGTCSPDIQAWGDFNKWEGDLKIRKTDTDDSPYFSINHEAIKKGLLEVFGFNIIAGDTTQFNDPKKAIIAESVAKSIYPNESPLGKVLQNQYGFQYTIVGVYKDFPKNCCISNGLIQELGTENMDNYSEWSFSLFVKLHSAESVSKVTDMMANEMIEMYKDDEEVTRAFQSSDMSKIIRLTPLSDIHFSKDIKYDWSEKASLSTTYSLLTIAILIIIIAIINFINFSMASVPLTIKGINTRKVLGCSNASLRVRQIIGSVIISIISLAVSFLIVYILSGTSFTSFISTSISLTDNILILVISAAVAVITGITAGLYPALYCTSFSPAMVIKGSFSLSPKGKLLRTGLISLQFIISLILIIVALFINVQSRFMKNYDMGYRSDNILTVSISSNLAGKSDSFTNKLKENPDIADVTYASGMIISNGKMGWGRYYYGKQLKFDCFPVSSNFINFFDMKIVEGRGFTIEDNQKRNGTMICNEAMIRTYPFIKVGDKIQGHIDDDPADVVGIAKDFNFQPLQYSINPIALYVFGSEPWWPITFCYIKTVPDSDIKKSIDYISTTIKEMDPNIVADDINVTFMDEKIGQLYQKEDLLGKLILIFCGLSVLISIIGILGLIYFETQFKKKEIGVRRVFGSSVANILEKLNLTYIKICLCCFVIAVPVSIIIIKQWLKSFTYQSTIPVWIFIASIAIILTITVIVITIQSYRAASANPVDSLRSE